MAQMKTQMRNDMRCDLFLTIFVFELFPTSFEQWLKDKNSFGSIAELAGW